MERQILERHIRELSQRARLREFAFSESGAMSAKKAAQMGAVLAGSVLAGLLMSAGTAEASCTQCGDDFDCGLPGAHLCRTFTCAGSCGSWCTDDPNPNPGPNCP